MNLEKLKNLPFFKDFDISSLSMLAIASTLKHFKKKEPLFSHGEEIKYFYVVVEGWIKLFRNTQDGQEIIIGLSKSTDILGEINFTNDFHTFCAMTISEVEAIIIPYLAFKEAIERNVNLSLQVIKSLSNNISLLELQLEHASSMSATQRVCCFILRMTNLHHTSFKIRLPYDKNIIASYLRMKGETFSRALSELKPLGISIRGSTLYIADINKLINFCCVSCSLVFDSCKN